MKKKRVEGATALFIILFLFLIVSAFFLNFILQNNFTIKEAIQYAKAKQTERTHITDYENYRNLKLSWIYNSKLYKAEIDVPFENYQFYKNITRPNLRDYAYYTNTKWYTLDTKEKELNELIKIIRTIINKNNIKKENIPQFILHFAQQFNAKKDFDDYSKFPIETIYEAGGDCEDTSILTAYLLLAFNYKPIFIEFEDHVGVGIKNETGNYNFNNQNYLYGETTSEGFNFGEVPLQYENSTPTMYLSDPQAILDLDWDIQKNTKKNEYLLNITISNLATIKTNIDLELQLEYLEENDKTSLNPLSSNKLELDSFAATNIIEKINFQNRTHRIIVSITSEKTNSYYTRTRWMK